MNSKLQLFIGLILIFIAGQIKGQEIIPLDTNNWEINASSYVLEPFEGKQSIYLKQGSINSKQNIQEWALSLIMST